MSTLLNKGRVSWADLESSSDEEDDYVPRNQSSSPPGSMGRPTAPVPAGPSNFAVNEDITLPSFISKEEYNRVPTNPKPDWRLDSSKAGLPSVIKSTSLGGKTSFSGWKRSANGPASKSAFSFGSTNAQQDRRKRVRAGEPTESAELSTPVGNPVPQNRENAELYQSPVANSTPGSPPSSGNTPLVNPWVARRQQRQFSPPTPSRVAPPPASGWERKTTAKLLQPSTPQEAEPVARSSGPVTRSQSQAMKAQNDTKQKKKKETKRVLPNTDVDEETWKRRQAQRQREIDVGKKHPSYQLYLDKVPKDQREKKHPSTPDPQQRCSKRAFSGKVKRWRRMIHEFVDSLDA